MKTNDSVLCADLTLLDLIHYCNINSIPRNVHTTNTQLPNYETVNCICSAYEREGGGGGRAKFHGPGARAFRATPKTDTPQVVACSPLGRTSSPKFSGSRPLSPITAF